MIRCLVSLNSETILRKTTPRSIYISIVGSVWNQIFLRKWGDSKMKKDFLNSSYPGMLNLVLVQPGHMALTPMSISLIEWANKVLTYLKTLSKFYKYSAITSECRSKKNLPLWNNLTDNSPIKIIWEWNKKNQNLRRLSVNALNPNAY